MLYHCRLVQYLLKMLANYGPVQQALLGTLFTWGLTAAGSAFVFIFKSGKVILSMLPFKINI